MKRTNILTYTQASPFPGRAVAACVLCLAMLSIVSSCQIMKEAAKEELMESIKDPKTGTPVFSRDNGYGPYSINVGNIVKNRRKAKRRKALNVLNAQDKPEAQ